ncbi:MAG: class I SAM-dependent methyltransferase [Actinomycetota bacterium]|nr:class I SAM-dependent methyltransferase [Actinomycetota bacterium]
MNIGAYLRERRFHESATAVAAYRGLRRGASKAGFQVVLKTFYSPIPELAELPAGIFERRSQLPGVRFDLDAQLAFLRDRAELMASFAPERYSADNPSYSLLDATVLYGVLRELKPRRVVELGSGQTTLVMAQAGRENAGESHPLRLDAYDPYPAVADDFLPGLNALHRVAAQDVPLAVFEELEAGDVLFVDTTHTVKVGSDVNFIVLEVLPRLAAGVVVHVHDVFLPYEYPRRWPEDFGLYWSEQYLVQAFLALNPSFEVLCAVAALHRDRHAELERLLPGPSVVDGSAFWMRRTA